MRRLASLVLLVGLGALSAACAKPSAESGAVASNGTSATTTSTGGGMASVSRFDAGARAGESAIAHERSEQGETLFKAKGCSACHTFGKRLTGPDLQGVSMRRTAEWIENQILHPDVMVKEDPISHGLFAQFALQMPKQGLTADEARSVIEYFKRVDHEAGLTGPESHR